MTRGWWIGLVVCAFGVDVANAQRLHTRRAVNPPAPPSLHTKPPRRSPPVSVQLTPGRGGTAPDDLLLDDAMRELAVGRAARARKLFYELIKNYPRSRHVPTVYVLFGDYFFNRGSMTNALRFYKRVLSGYPSYTHADYVRARLGWVHMNNGDYQQALNVLVTAARAPRPPSSAMLPYIEEGIVLAYAHIGLARRAFAFFQRISPGSALALLEQLGHAYSDRGKSKEAVTVFRALLQKQPKSARACDWQWEIARLALLGGSKPAAAKELEAALRRAAPKPCARRVGALAYWAATTWHREANRAKGKGQLLALAARLYGAYARAFPRGRHGASVSYFHAEALWRLAALENDRRRAKARWLQAAAAFHYAAAVAGQSPNVAARARRAARLASENASRR